jgi:AcrR family transcriptional regulator
MDTKERILLKAHELFNRYGIRSVSMDDLSAQLGMSKKTLYQYFADKDELVNAINTIAARNRSDRKMHCTRCSWPLTACGICLPK